MPVPHLLIADTALRSALIEQLPESASGQVPPDTAILVVDAAMLGKETLKQMCDLRAANNKAKIFLLGEAGEEIASEIDENLITESFAKPLRIGHLLGRLQFHMQAPRIQTEHVLFGSFRLEPAARQVVLQPGGNVIRLTEKETHLLEFLGRSEKPVPREELLAAIWGYDGRIDTHTLETHIYRLRRKLDPEGSEDTTIIASNGAYGLAAVKRQ